MTQKSLSTNGIPDTENKLVVDKGEGLEKGEGKALIWRTWFKALVNKCEPGEQCNIITVVGWTTTHE